MKNNQIQIIVGTDENFIVPQYVMLHSLLHWMDKEREVVLNVLSNASLSKKSEALIKSLENDNANCSVSFHLIENEYDEDKLFLKHTTAATMLRLEIPRIFCDLDKCIYLDGDMVICGDVSQLFDIEIEEYYIAGVHDIVIEQSSGFPHISYQNNSFVESYFNAGVLVMNLKKMREDRLYENFKKLSEKKFPFADQDILNIACSSNVKFVPLKFNNMATNLIDLNYRLNEYREDLIKRVSLSEIHEAIDKPIVLHYATAIKPWNCRWIYQAKRWYKHVHNNIDKSIQKEWIRPYIKDKKLGFNLQLNKFIKWIMYKIGLRKIILKKQNRL